MMHINKKIDLEDVCNWLNSEQSYFFQIKKKFIVINEELYQQYKNNSLETKTIKVTNIDIYVNQYIKFIEGKYGMFVKTYGLTISGCDYVPDTFILILISSLYESKEECEKFSIPNEIKGSRLTTEMLHTSNLEKITSSIYTTNIIYNT